MVTNQKSGEPSRNGTACGFLRTSALVQAPLASVPTFGEYVRNITFTIPRYFHYLVLDDTDSSTYPGALP